MRARLVASVLARFPRFVRLLFCALLPMLILPRAADARARPDIDPIRAVLSPALLAMERTDREVLWNQPPDVSGYKFSSEMLDQQSGTQVAEDFLFPAPAVVLGITFWGGYYYWYPGDPEVSSYNLRFYSDAGCDPRDVLNEYSGLIPETHFVGYDGYGYPTYSYEVTARFEAEANTAYWFVAQAGNHPFPPSWGRQQAAEEVGCPAMYNDGWYWEWTEVGVSLDEPFDASQVLTGWYSGAERACCFDDGHCEVLSADFCAERGGVVQDETAACDPNPCDPPQACCFEDGSCALHGEDACRALRGEPQGPGTACDPNPCPASGACCLPGGGCVTSGGDLCRAWNGVWHPGWTCDPDPCAPVPALETTWGSIRRSFR